jgi:hypothetical protein
MAARAVSGRLLVAAALAALAVAGLAAAALVPERAYAHRSGCHSAHTCPSDHHTYVWYDPNAGRGWDCAEPGASEFNASLNRTVITLAGIHVLLPRGGLDDPAADERTVSRARQAARPKVHTGRELCASDRKTGLRARLFEPRPQRSREREAGRLRAVWDRHAHTWPVRGRPPGQPRARRLELDPEPLARSRRPASRSTRRTRSRTTCTRACATGR